MNASAIVAMKIFDRGRHPRPTGVMDATPSLSRTDLIVVFIVVAPSANRYRIVVKPRNVTRPV
jgi:hypothetical protein